MLIRLSRSATFALLSVAISANAQVSVPPATYRPVTPDKAQIETALLLPTDAAARSILLSTPTSAEREALTSKVATKASKDGIVPKRRRRTIGFARQVPSAHGSFRLSDLAWSQTAGSLQAAHVSLTSSGAAAIRIGLVFTGVPPELEVRFKGASSSAPVFGPYPAEAARESIYWSPVLEGETGTIELALPAGVSPAGTVSLPMISHLVVAGNALRQADPLGQIGQSGRCDASLLALENTDRPYRLDVQAKAGSTGAKFKGSIVPTRIDNIDGVLALQGRDLSLLYPIIPVPFPWTPPYRLSGNLKHRSGVWSFSEFSGKFGDSDLTGRLDVERKSERTIVDAELVSQRLNYKDLGGLVGLPPPSAPAEKSTTAQNKEAAKREVSGRLLPTKPYGVEGLRAVDAMVHLKGKRFIASDLPLDNLDAVLDLKDGVLKLQPLDFGVAGGHLASTLTMDARDKIIKTTGNVTVRNVELKQIVPALKPPKGSAGKVGGRAHFTATGNSVADMLATSSGEVALISWGGDASELAIVLSNLDLARAAELLLRGDANSPIRCVVADFIADNGVMDAKTLVVDTEAEKILGQGSIDFARERYDLKLNAQAKRPSLIALRGPIVIDGSFKNPNVHPAVGPIVARVGTSLALGALNPLAGLLALIDFGGASDANCRALIAEASGNVQATATAKKAATN